MDKVSTTGDTTTTTMLDEMDKIMDLASLTFQQQTTDTITGIMEDWEMDIKSDIHRKIITEIIITIQ